jgi:hypothetical protein
MARPIMPYQSWPRRRVRRVNRAITGRQIAVVQCIAHAAEPLTEIAILLIVWLIAFLAIWLNGMIAVRLSVKHKRPRTPSRNIDQVTPREFVEELGDRVSWHLLVLVVAARPSGPSSRFRRVATGLAI